MFIYYVFLARDKDQGNVWTNAEKPRKWLHSVKQGRRYSLQRVFNLLHWNTISLQRVTNSLQRRFSASKDQCANREYSLRRKLEFTAAKTRHPDKLVHETLGYKRGRISHFREEKRERERPECSFREKNTERNQFHWVFSRDFKD